MQMLPYSGLERAGSSRDQNLVRVGQLVGPQSIKGVVELNAQSAATRKSLSSHVADGTRRATEPALG